MLCTLSHRLKVAWRNNGASPSPAASRQPGARCSEASVADARRQKDNAAPGRIEARVRAAIGPCSGACTLAGRAVPAQVPRLEKAFKITAKYSRAWARYAANSGAESKKVSAEAASSNTQNRPWREPLGRKPKPASWPLPRILKKRSPGTPRMEKRPIT